MNTEFVESVVGFDSSGLRHLLRINLIEDWVRISHSLTVQSYDEVRKVVGEWRESPIRLSLWAGFIVIFTFFLSIM